MLDASFNKISKYAYKDTIFDAREDKVKESAFYFADLFLMRKKKEAWTEYLRLLEVGEPAESIAGALIYKLKVSRIDGKIKSELIYKIMSIIALDHDGKLESEKEIEKLILSL
jgi:DNA polymerase III delta subunit